MEPWLIAIFGIVCTLIIALQSWILLEIIKLKVAAAEHEIQNKRFLADAESEKETRKDTNAGIIARLVALEKRRT